MTMQVALMGTPGRPVHHTSTQKHHNAEQHIDNPITRSAL